jgi:hypothetical protein
MIMNAKPLQRGICGDTNARGRARSRRLELYTQSIFGGLRKKSSQSFCRLRRQTALGGVRLMETRSRNEDDKLSTEPGQLQTITLPT